MKTTYNNPFGCDRHSHTYPTATRRRCPNCGHEQVAKVASSTGLENDWINVNPTDWQREDELRAAAGALA